MPESLETYLAKPLGRATIVMRFGYSYFQSPWKTNAAK
jgi:hypothetical protein